MAAQRTTNHLRILRRATPITLPVRPRRCFATVSDVNDPTTQTSAVSSSPSSQQTSLTVSVTPLEATEPPARTVLTTIYKFPTMEPERFTYYPTSHLNMPLRRDLLHRAIVYEGHSERQGTASSKWRDEVHGSGRKLYQQKGTGKARVGDKKSPIRRGGGVAFGPKPRDFSTELPRKIYDQAWRTALSYRYRQGELVIVNSFNKLPSTTTDYTRQMFDNNGWGKSGGKSLLIAETEAPNSQIWRAMAKDYADGKGPKNGGRIISVDKVDVKNLLETGRIIIEFRALNMILHKHASDLVPTLKSLVKPNIKPSFAEPLEDGEETATPDLSANTA